MASIDADGDAGLLLDFLRHLEGVCGGKDDGVAER